jgi:hypothetical protein
LRQEGILTVIGKIFDSFRPKLVVTDENLPEVLAALDHYAGEKKLDDWQRYLFAERLSASVYPRFKFSEFGRIWLHDELFFARYKRFMDPDNWHSCDRKFLLKELLNWTYNVPGDYAECGVYTGGSAIFLCEAAERFSKHVHLFDSFEGLSKPGEHDGEYWDEGALAFSFERVSENLGASAYFTCHKGWIPEKFPDVADKWFSFVHVDVDLYEPTRDTLEFFYPRLEAGGVILLDDHGFSTCPGARKAALEFFADKAEKVADVPTGQGLVVRRMGNVVPNYKAIRRGRSEDGSIRRSGSDTVFHNPDYE